MDKANVNEMSARISKIRLDFCYGNNKEFAERLGKSSQYASMLCSGESNPGTKMLEHILTVFKGVRREWLYFGKGPMMEEGIEEPKEEEQHKPPKEDDLRSRVDEQSATIKTLQSYISMLEKRVAELESEISKG